MIKKGDKRGFELDVLAYWIIGIIVLVIVLVMIAYLNGYGQGLIDGIKNLFRFGK